jgi:hypothetical protein
MVTTIAFGMLTSSRFPSKNPNIKVLLVVLYGCETWVCRFEGRTVEGALTTTGLWMGKIGRWRPLHNKEVHNLNCSINYIMVTNDGAFLGGCDDDLCV